MTDLALALTAFNVSRETADRLDVYAALLQKWSRKINLVGPDTLETAATRHFHDSAQVFDLCDAAPERWVDLGSGGGFPGLVLAIMAKGAGWKTEFTLIESDQRKAAFLRTVSRETETPVKVIAERIEVAAPGSAGCISARALAPLPRLFPLVQRHIDKNGTAFLPKGRNYQQELKEVRDNFTFSLEIHPSQTDSEAVILEIGDIRDV